MRTFLFEKKKNFQKSPSSFEKYNSVEERSPTRLPMITTSTTAPKILIEKVIITKHLPVSQFFFRKSISKSKNSKNQNKVNSRFPKKPN